jgi:plastocyanin
MNGRKWIWLSAALLVLALAGCGEKAVPAGAARNTPASLPTPIDPSTAGSVTGKIIFEGARPAPKRIMMDQDPDCVQKHGGKPVFAEDGEVNGNGTLPNVLVYVKSGAEKYTFAPPVEPVVLDQDGCMYKPHVLGIMAGQVLKIVTSDSTTHNIHPTPKNNREWNMAQMPGAAPIEQKFARPEIMVPVRCNQHPWMRAWIGVTANPFFAVSGSDGTFTIKGLPPGDYTFAAWTATFGTQEQKATIAPKETKTVEFKFKAS